MTTLIREFPKKALQAATSQLFIFLVMMMFVSPATAGDAVSKTLSVADAIEADRIVNTTEDYPNTPDRTAIFSPDRKRFLIHTRRGDLRTNVMVDTLSLFDSTDVSALLSGTAIDARAPQRILVVEIRSHHDWDAMDRVQWIDDRNVAFTAEGANGHLQAYVVNVDTRVVKELTHSDSDVGNFAIGGGRTLYYEYVGASAPQVVRMDERPVGSFLWEDKDPRDLPMRLVIGSRAGDGSAPKKGPLISLGPNDRIWISPSGRYAITLAPSEHVPGYWSAYKMIPSWAFPDVDKTYGPNDVLAALRPIYQLVDLETGSSKKLLDAPTGNAAGDVTPLSVFWMDDEQSVILSNTFLPLRGVDHSVAAARAEAPGAVEVNLRTGNATSIFVDQTIVQYQHNPGQPFEPLTDLQWDPSSKCISLTRKMADETFKRSRYCRTSNGWLPSPAVDIVNGSDAFRVQRMESLNERPRLYALGGRCGCRRLLFDPAPQFEAVAFGHIEEMEWKDASGATWRAGLLYPPNYVAGRRYPLVVQTHGFRTDQFLLMGPGDNAGVGTAYAAQPLAGAGFLVLQIGDNFPLMTQDEKEGPAIAQGWHTGIQQLIDRGIVDPSRIGLIGFSRTGYHLIHFLAAYPGLLAAANISDSLQPGYMQRVLTVNYPIKEKDDGPGPHDIGFPAYFATNPLYQLPNARAALRIEGIGPASVVAMLETYDVLRESGKPVDLVYFPEGSHNLQKPSERIGSQQGNVDWFRFWLQDYEDPDPAKLHQYERWRDLKARRQTTLH
jgi:dipeptidyl aminopeptidase/acylaminoacyl peptidase